MTARRLYVPAAMPSRDANGRALPGKLRFYEPTGTYDESKTVYSDNTLATALSQPISSNAYGHFPEIWADSAQTFDVTYSDQVYDRQLGAYANLTPLSDAAAASVALAESAEDSAVDAQTAAEAAQAAAEAAAIRSGFSTIEDYGAVAGVGSDSSAGVTAARTALGTWGGGPVLVPASIYRVNDILSQSNTYLSGGRGVGEDDTHATPALRPWSTAAGKSTLQIGDGTTLIYNVRLENLVISGDNGSGTMAPAALLAKGVWGLYGDNLDLRDGTRTLDLSPSATQPVTSVFLQNFNLRNSGSGSTSRGIYAKRLADPGYVTAIAFSHGHVSGPTGGYAMELDGSSAALRVSVNDIYWDMTAGHGLKFTGSASISGVGNIYDPAATGAVVFETDQTPTPKDPTAFLNGQHYCAAQKFQWGDASTTTFPTYAEWFFRSPSINTMYFYGTQYLGKSTNFYDTTQSLDMESDTGPYRLNGTPFKVTDTTDATASNTGSLRTLGGAAVTKALWVGTTIKAASNNFQVDAAGRVDSTFLVSSGDIRAGAANGIFWSGRTTLTCPADGVINPTKSAGGQLTVATLPSAATAGAGARAFVTDANATTFASVVAGSGSNGVPVYSDGTNWRIG